MKFLWVILFLTGNILAQKSEIFRVWGTTETGIVSSPVRIGVREDATKGLDTDFEKEIFPGNPVGEFGIICRVNYFDPTQQLQVYSYNDFIPYMDDQFYYEHNLEVILDYGRKHTVHWDDMRGLADSAFLTIGNDFIKVDMLENTEYYVDNENVTNWNYTVKIYYHPALTTTSIEEDTDLKDLSIFPNPVSDVLKVETALNIENYQIFDLSGNYLSKKLSFDGSIELNTYTNGSYFIVFNTSENKDIIKHVVVFK